MFFSLEFMQLTFKYGQNTLYAAVFDAIGGRPAT